MNRYNNRLIDHRRSKEAKLWNRRPLDWRADLLRLISSSINHVNQIILSCLGLGSPGNRGRILNARTCRYQCRRAPVRQQRYEDHSFNCFTTAASTAAHCAAALSGVSATGCSAVGALTALASTASVSAAGVISANFSVAGLGSLTVFTELLRSRCYYSGLLSGCFADCGPGQSTFQMRPSPHPTRPPPPHSGQQEQRSCCSHRSWREH